MTLSEVKFLRRKYFIYRNNKEIWYIQNHLKTNGNIDIFIASFQNSISIDFLFYSVQCTVLNETIKAEKFNRDT